jgi:hypothetical protein
LQHAQWSPILEGELRERARAAVAETVSLVRGQRGGTPSVALGLAGFALLLMEASRVQPRLASPRDVERMVARLLPRVEALPLSPGLHEGYTGVGLTLELIRRAGFARVDGAEALDRALLASIERFDAVPPALAHLDLISGLAGQALYACARLPRIRARRALEAIVGWLDRRAVAAAGGVTWLSPPRPHARADQLPGSVFDLGIAHGVPGILAALARILEAGIAVPTTRRLLEAGTRWLLQQVHDRAGPAFDTYVPSDPAADRGAAFPPMPSRLGWCYGDPGVAAALLATARALDDGRLRATAMVVLQRIAAIRSDPTVQDASLCHGTAGLLHIFNRIYQATGDPAARDAAIHWAERTLVLRAGPHAIAADPPPDDSPFHPLRFLAGAAGSALALLAAASPTVPSWDAIVLLDVPPATAGSADFEITRRAPAPRNRDRARSGREADRRSSRTGPSSRRRARRVRGSDRRRAGLRVRPGTGRARPTSEHRAGRGERRRRRRPRRFPAGPA